MATRTLNTEVDVPNKDGKLLPGSFGQVHFAVGECGAANQVPVNAMLFRAEGPQVAVVGSDDKVELRSIVIGRDFGATLEILVGMRRAIASLSIRRTRWKRGSRCGCADSRNQSQPGSRRSHEIKLKLECAASTALVLHGDGF